MFKTIGIRAACFRHRDAIPCLLSRKQDRIDAARVARPEMEQYIGADDRTSIKINRSAKRYGMPALDAGRPTCPHAA